MELIQVPSMPPKSQISTVVPENCKKSAVGAGLKKNKCGGWGGAFTRDLRVVKLLTVYVESYFQVTPSHSTKALELAWKINARFGDFG